MTNHFICRTFVTFSQVYFGFVILFSLSIIMQKNHMPTSSKRECSTHPTLCSLTYLRAIFKILNKYKRLRLLLRREALKTPTNEGSNAMEPLTDPFGRLHDYIRISVTDRCNLRCIYCMPAEGMEFQPQDEILSYEEITAIVESLAPLDCERYG